MQKNEINRSIIRTQIWIIALPKGKIDQWTFQNAEQWMQSGMTW